MKKAIFFLLVLALVACNKSKYQNNYKSDTQKVNNSIRINLFTHTVADTLGCRCYYSVDSVEFRKKRFLYMNNMADTSYMKINGEFVKFILDENQNKPTRDQKYPVLKFHGGNYTLLLEVLKEEAKNELVTFSNGKLTVSDKAGNKMTTSFYG